MRLAAVNASNPAPILDLMEAFRRSKTMFAGVALGVFDRLERAPADAVTLAADLHSQTEPLERLLDACVALGLLTKRDGCYANKPVASAYLCRASERTLTGYILYSNNVLFRLWTYLEDAIREGGPRWKQAFGADRSIFDHFFKTEDDMRTFVKGMHGLGVLSSPAVIAAFDLSRFHRLVDLGGATGHLTIAATLQYPALEAVVFDLPSVLEVTREELVRWPSVSSRIELCSGDFFRDDIPEADLIAVSRILHDWSDEKVHELLDRIYRALPAGGSVLIAEKLLADDKIGPVSANMQSLNMLVCTEGRERTLTEYRDLLTAAGFNRVRGRVTGTPLDAVMATKDCASEPARREKSYS
jgi:acetylserotonin N-methyltransferase